MVSSIPSSGTVPVRASVRFPLHLAVELETDERAYTAMTKDVSANGVLFVADQELPPVNSAVRFRLNMPAAVMGGSDDVVLYCTGRIVRSLYQGNRAIAAAVIDGYSLKAEQV